MPCSSELRGAGVSCGCAGNSMKVSADELVAAVDVKLASLSCRGGVASDCPWVTAAGGALYLAGRGASSVAVGVGGVFKLLCGAGGLEAS